MSPQAPDGSTDRSENTVQRYRVFLTSTDDPEHPTTLCLADEASPSETIGVIATTWRWQPDHPETRPSEAEKTVSWGDGLQQFPGLWPHDLRSHSLVIEKLGRDGQALSHLPMKYGRGPDSFKEPRPGRALHEDCRVDERGHTTTSVLHHQSLASLKGEIEAFIMDPSRTTKIVWRCPKKPADPTAADVTASLARIREITEVAWRTK